LTLVELLVGSLVALLVGGAAMAFMIVSINQENGASSRTVAARVAETTLEQLARDLRQAMTQDASGNALHVSVQTDSTRAGCRSTWRGTAPTTTTRPSISARLRAACSN
jgi:type II secretory pathway pseudopilin PulG